jgi:hypothetical protein
MTQIEKEYEHGKTWVKKHLKWIVALGFMTLLLWSPLGLSLLNIVNPGFPGAMTACYGVNFKDFGTDWSGTNTIHLVNNSETTLVSHTGYVLGFQTSQDRVYWGAGTGPASMTVEHWHGEFTEPDKEQQLSTEVQTNIPLADFNYQNSTPLQFSNASTWDQGQLLQYWNTQANTVNTTLSNGTIIMSTTYNETSQSLLLIPGNFHLDVYIPSSNHDADTMSGWQEGTWNQVDFWYTVYWYEWLNAYGPVLQQNEKAPPIPANALNRQDKFNLVGGFPIQGWIQGLVSPYPTSSGTINDAFSATPAKGGSTGTPIPASTVQNLKAQMQMQPGLTGQPVTLYTQPSDQYVLPTYTLPSGPLDSNTTAQGLLKSPDFQTVLPAEYFKIGVQTLGTYSEGNAIQGWTVYYPTVDYLLRFIFGVYGVHTYIWTVSTAISQGYNATQNYQVPPAQWEDRTTITATKGGALQMFTDWFSNPLNALQFYFMVIVVVLILVTVLNPGVWSNVLGRRKEKT